MVTKFYRVEFTIKGKSFPCIVRFKEGEKHWTCIYLNKDNPNDWFIRKEVLSPELLKFGSETIEEVYKNRLNKILEKIHG